MKSNDSRTLFEFMSSKRRHSCDEGSGGGTASGGAHESGSGADGEESISDSSIPELYSDEQEQGQGQIGDRRASTEACRLERSSRGDQRGTRLTPFQVQYRDIKRRCPNAVVFFKKGKFYELFEEDADIGARLFGMKMSNSRGLRMVGFPDASYEHWERMFIEKGFRIGRVDQLENEIGKRIRLSGGLGKYTGTQNDTRQPADEGAHLNTNAGRAMPCKKDEKIIRRELAEIITPGTHYNSTTSNYLCVGIIKDNTTAILYDSTENRLRYAVFHNDRECVNFRNLFSQYSIKELILENVIGADVGWIDPAIIRVDSSEYSGGEISLSISDYKVRCHAEYLPDLNRCFNYLNSYMNRLVRLSYLNTLEVCEFGGEDSFSLDDVTVRNIGVKRELFNAINHCVTQSGSRLLMDRLLHPLTSPRAIYERHRMTMAFQNVIHLRSELRCVGDIDKAIGRCKRGSPKLDDLTKLMRVLKDAGKFTQILKDEAKSVGCEPLTKFVAGLPDIQRVIDDFRAEYTIGEEISSSERGDLLDLIDVKNGLENKLEEYRAKQANLVGVEVVYKDLGKEPFQLEVPTGTAVPDYYQLVSSTKTARRYYTSELRKIVERYAEVKELIFQRRCVLIKKATDFVLERRETMYKLSRALSEVDVFISMAMLDGVYPRFKDADSQGTDISIRGMRNAVYPEYVMNDILVDNLVLFGPNMGGKSTLLRSLCYATILAQVGCKVPCESYNSKLFSGIFCRIGASDNMALGQSTFYVELSETKRMLQKGSLVILDELGRGTSVKDGRAIAKAVVEYMVKNKISVMFSTHYHSLFEDGGMLSFGYMSVKVDEDITFLYKLCKGRMDNSFGVEVATKAGVPTSIIERAREIKSSLINEPRDADTEVLNEKCNTV